MKKVIAFILCMLMGLSAMAQEWVDKKNVVSVSWGTVTHPQIAEAFTSVFASVFNGKSYEWKANSGAISLSYMRRLNKHFLVGAGLTYEYFKEGFRGTSSADYIDHYVTLMADVKADWFNKQYVSMYSRVGVGPTFVRGYSADGSVKCQKDDSEEWMFGFQVSAIGLEVGNATIRGFLELGYGVDGVALVGLRCGF